MKEESVVQVIAIVSQEQEKIWASNGTLLRQSVRKPLGSENFHPIESSFHLESGEENQR